MIGRDPSPQRARAPGCSVRRDKRDRDNHIEPPQFLERHQGRHVRGEKKAREVWFLCRRYKASEALALGLVNKVVPDDQLDAEVDRWCAEIVNLSPTAIAIAKASFNADSENIKGIGGLGFNALALYYGTDEAKEAGQAFREKRKPNFRKKPGASERQA